MHTRKFTSKERDTESGLDYFGARYYDSIMGRFSSPDPLLHSADPMDPQSWNRYSYVMNNPLDYIDDDGRQAIVVWRDRTPWEAYFFDVSLFKKDLKALLKGQEPAVEMIGGVLVDAIVPDSNAELTLMLAASFVGGGGRMTGPALERFLARSLSGSEGVELVAVGDAAVRSFLGLSAGAKSVDLLAKAGDNVFSAIEAKTGRNIDIADVLGKFNTVVTGIENLGKKVGDLVLRVSRKYRIKNGSVDAAGFLLDKNGNRVVARGGHYIKVVVQ